jgi:hypothetical protein
MFRPALEPTEPPSHCILGAVSQMGKLAGVWSWQLTFI